MTKWVSTTLGLVVLVVGTVLVTLGVTEAARRGNTPEDRPAPSGSPSPATTGTVAAARVALAAADLTTPASCDDLLDSYIDRALDLVGPYGWDAGPIVMFDAAIPRARDSVAGAAESSAKAPMPTTSRVTSGETGTNVQEAGVDEPDGVKVDGDLLWRVQDDELTAYDVSGDEPRQLATLELPDVDDAELLLAEDRLVAVGHSDERGSRQGTAVLTVDASDPRDPRVVNEQHYTAELLEARLHDGVVRLVLRNGLPDLEFVHRYRPHQEDSAQRANEQAVRESTLDDWLPLRDGEQLLDCGSVAVPDDDDDPLGTTSVVALDPAEPAEAESTAVATAATAAYSSTDRLYLAVSPSSWGWGGPPCWEICDFAGPLLGGDDDGETELFAYALDGVATTLVASGEVEGTVRDRWAMDFAGDALRVAVGPSQATGDFNSVVTLREEGAELVEAGRVDDLGKGEEIKSVRWFDDLALVVTFRQTDPLYAIDLADADDPELMGELKIPGFSEYLHPLGERRLIGMGQDASLRGITRGAQAALFDVTDLTEPRRLDTVTYARGSWAGAGTDPRQFTWLPERRTALTVITHGWRTGYVSVLELGDDRMSNRMVEVEHGDEVSEVRLVPLASGKVVLVTGDEVTFFDL
ncbi:beta-propeller domain-containing protein [Nocardioides gansuensis]|nr:beta-propeller domain-containing protein [Nocardioides gansuensis]